MPQRLFANAGAQSTCASAITSAQTTVTLQSASGFPPVVSGQQFSVTILDSGNPAFNANNPLATPYEYQQVNAVSGNVLTFGPGGGAASRVNYAGTTTKAFFAGATIALAMLAEDINASFPIKLGEQVLLNPAASVTLTPPTSGFRRLLLWWKSRSDSGTLQAILMQLNGDTAANYYSSWGEANGTAPFYTGQSLGVTSATVGHVPAAASSNWGTGRIEFFDPYNTTQKLFLLHWLRVDGGGSGNLVNDFGGGEWSNSAAITSIVLRPAAGSFVAGSMFTLDAYP